VATLHEQVCWCLFSSSICSLLVSGSHFGNNSQNISSFFLIIFVMVICDQWTLMLHCNCFGTPETFPIYHSELNVCILSTPPTGHWCLHPYWSLSICWGHVVREGWAQSLRLEIVLSGSVDTPLRLLQDFCGSCPPGDAIPFFPQESVQALVSDFWQ